MFLRRHAARIAAFLFIAFLLVVVSIANRGEGGNWWAFLGRIPYGDKLGHVGLMGGAEELTQAFIPTRTCDLFDWLADVVGITAGQLLAARLRR